MQTSTVLLIVLAAIVALILVLYHYFFRTGKRSTLYVVLAFLRFLAVFGLLVLLINPKFSKYDYRLEKAQLLVLTDNSSSVASSSEGIATILKAIDANTALSDKFDIEHFAFGNALEKNDSLSHEAKNTNIAKALVAINEIYANSNAALVMLTDGNSTVGADYVSVANKAKFPVMPMSIGDTTRFEDLRIDQVNSNKYAFLKNKYPLEVYVSYDGTAEVNTAISVRVNGNTVYREPLRLSRSANAKNINTLLEANSVGLKNITITVEPLTNERNTANNTRNTVIEVIDEKTNIALISNMLHPDIGALRKAIESNEQRSVRILKPTIDLDQLDAFDVFLLYQPDASFSSVYQYLQQKRASIFTIGGTKTHWNTLNRADRKYTVEDGYPTQEVFGQLNPSFSKFDISDLSMNEYPPLHSDAGAIAVENGEALMFMKVLGTPLKSPLLFAQDNENGKEVVLAGENIWKWRMQSYRNDQNFQNFDTFIGKIIRYLSSSKGRNRLEVDYQSVYEGGHGAKLKASYFDEAFVFDANASLLLRLTHTENGVAQEIPMLLKDNYYEVDLSDIAPGGYQFSVVVAEENRSRTGSFTILDFDLEKQFQSTNYKKLAQLARATDGKLYFADSTNVMLSDLINDQRFVPTQLGTKNIVSLIDFRVLLALIIAALAAEWFLRKYNGLT